MKIPAIDKDGRLFEARAIVGLTYAGTLRNGKATGLETYPDKATALAARTLAGGVADARTAVDQVIAAAKTNAPVAGGGGFIGF